MRCDWLGPWGWFCADVAIRLGVVLDESYPRLAGREATQFKDLAKEYPCGASEFTSAEPLQPNMAARRFGRLQTPRRRCLIPGAPAAAFEHDRNVLSS